MRPVYCLFLILPLLASCTFGVPITRDRGSVPTQPKTTQKLERGNPSSYIVLGRQYHVLNSSSGFTQRGVASWYGKKFHGKKTSNGETYNMYAMTAAHKTLPLPTWVRVQNLDNGKSVVVRVNDRGPFVNERVIDLSYTAATKLDMVKGGTARVEISALKSSTDRSRPVVRTIPLKTADTGPAGTIFIQMGSFASEANAINLKLQLLGAKQGSARIDQILSAGKKLFRVRVGPVLDFQHAQSVMHKLKKQGFSQARIVIQD